MPAAGRRSASWLCCPRATSPAQGGSGQSGAGTREQAEGAACCRDSKLPRLPRVCMGEGCPATPVMVRGQRAPSWRPRAAAGSGCGASLPPPARAGDRRAPVTSATGQTRGPAPALLAPGSPPPAATEDGGKTHGPPPTPSSELCPSTSLPCAATALGTVSPRAATHCLPPPAPSLPGVTPHPKCRHRAAPGAAPHLGTRPAQGWGLGPASWPRCKGPHGAYLLVRKGPRELPPKAPLRSHVSSRRALLRLPSSLSTTALHWKSYAAL